VSVVVVGAVVVDEIVVAPGVVDRGREFDEAGVYDPETEWYPVLTTKPGEVSVSF
jgi:hypothetical protein